MEITQAKKFLVDRAFISFPGVLQWVNAASANPAGTIATWAEVLDDVSIDEAESALRWMLRANERVEPFRFASDLRERAIALRPKQNKALEEIRAGIAEAYERNQTAGAMAKVTAQPLWTDTWIPLHDRVERGELAKEQALAIFRDALDAFYGPDREVGYI